MIHAVPFASCYVYSPSGADAACRRSRYLRALIKAGDARLIARYAARVRQQASETPALGDFFGATDILVPVPGCQPRPPGAVSVTDRLAAAFVLQGLGRATWPGLRRIQAVCKSASAPLRVQRFGGTSIRWRSILSRPPLMGPAWYWWTTW